MGGPGIRYSSEFKAEAVAQIIDRGCSVREVAKRIGVPEHSLYKWVRRAPGDDQETSGSGDSAAENAGLELELERAEGERDILRKAAAYFAKESERGTPS